MTEYRIVDAHFHTFPSAESGEQAMQGAGRSGCSGTTDEFLSIMKESGISHAVMANMTPTYDMRMAALEKLPDAMADEDRKAAEEEIREKMISRMQRRNLWTCTMGKENQGLIPLISIDILQTSSEMVKEIEQKVRDHGAGGIKLHPVSNRFVPGDNRFWPAYSKAEEMGLPILFHSGEGELAGYTDADYGRPRNFDQVLKAFPRLTLVLAHMGQGFLEESVLLARNHDNVHFDTSAIFSKAEDEGGLTDEEAVKLIRRIGTDRVLFGSDFPWFHPQPAAERIKNLEITEEEKQMILSKNAMRVFLIEENA
jgi:predicted TIM-barrel fold metal-dependent hydrolase